MWEPSARERHRHGPSFSHASARRARSSPSTPAVERQSAPASPARRETKWPFRRHRRPCSTPGPQGSRSHRPAPACRAGITPRGRAARRRPPRHRWRRPLRPSCACHWPNTRSSSSTATATRLAWRECSASPRRPPLKPFDLDDLTVVRAIRCGVRVACTIALRRLCARQAEEQRSVEKQDRGNRRVSASVCLVGRTIARSLAPSFGCARCIQWSRVNTTQWSQAVRGPMRVRPSAIHIETHDRSVTPLLLL